MDEASAKPIELAARRAQLSRIKQALLEKRLQSQVPGVVAASLVPRRTDDRPAPLSFAQQRLWFIHQLAPGTTAYNIPTIARLKGRLHLSALEQGFQEIVRRHAILRTALRIVDGQLVQVVEPNLRVPLDIVDLQAFAAPERKAELARRINQEAEWSFDLAQAPLLRATLFRLDEEEHVLCLVIHHSICDMWSLRVFMRELAALYDAPSLSLPELPIQYADYATWERQWLGSAAWESQLEYWKQQLSGASPLLNLPTDHPRPAIQNFHGAVQIFSLPPDLSQALKDLCHREGVTLFMVLLTALQTLLYRYTGQEDIVVSTSVANRNKSVLEPLIGCFINILLLRTDVSGDPGFRELLHRVRLVALQAFAHQDLPFELLVDALQPERDLSYTPYAQVMLVVHPAPFEPPQLRGLISSPVAFERRAAQFDWTLHMWDAKRENALGGFVEYNTDLFDAATVCRMLDHWQVLLKSIVADPDRRLSQLRLLTTVERHQLLVEWNRTDTAYPQYRCIQQWIEEQAERTPDGLALVFEEQHLTYRELDRRANQLAHYLHNLGIGPEERVGICVERSLEMVIGLLGILKAGGAYVPLDPTYPMERLAFMLEDAQTPVLLTQKHLAQRLSAGRARVVCLDADWETIAAESTTSPICDVIGENLAYVIYTSGSTGQPKGAMNTHAGIRNRLLWMQEAYRLTASERVMQKTPFSFDVSVWEFFWPLMMGACLVVARPEGHKDNAYLRGLIAEQRITTLHFVPSMLQAFLETPGLETCDSLRRIVCSGEALPFDLQERCLARLQVELHNLYGPTEAAVDVTAWACEHRLDRVVPIGRPIANIQIYLLDQAGQPVPVGVPGELYIGGIGLARGYWNRAALTAEKFIPNPFSVEPGARLYRTGDLARYLPDGNIEYLGRVDFQVKVRGFRIELGEIEAALAQHPAVRETVVVARAEEHGDKRLVAYVVPDQAARPTVSELRAFLKQHLPDYMIPAAFLTLDALPLSPNGKVDRRALPAPEHARPELETVFVAPRTQAEEVLAGIWSQVLGIERIGIHDNFFALGGDSIRSITILARAEAQGLSFSLQQLFQHPTIAELASQLESAESRGAMSAPVEPFGLVTHDDRLRLPEDVEDAYPLSTLQAGLVVESEMHPGTALYHDIMSYRIRGSFDPAAFEAAVQNLVNRHPILRTAYDLNRFSEPLQLVYRTVQPSLQVEDWRTLSPAQQEEGLALFVADERRLHFDWARPALVRFVVHILSDEVFQYTLSFHDSTLDGWSVNSLNAELFQTYLSLLAGKETWRRAPPAVAYRDFVALEQAAVQSADCQAYWNERLRDSTFTRLPRWPSTHSIGEGAQIQYLSVPIPAEVSDGLKKLALSAAVPLKSVLLAAHARVMSMLSGQTDVVTGLEHNGRLEGLDGEQVLGLFLNTIPFRMKLPGGTWIELAHQAFQTERELLPFRRYPMARLQWRQHGQPLFEAVFNYTHFHVVQNLLNLREIELLNLSAVLETEYPFRAEFNRNPVSDQIELALHYDDNLFGREQMDLIGGYYLQALSAMATNPSGRYETRSLLSDHEQRQLLVEWNDSQSDYPSAQCFHQLFEEQVRRTPDATAVVCDQEQLSYDALNRRANRWARSMVEHGVGPDVLVAVLAERGIDLLTAILAILKTGGVYLPLDPRHPAERTREIVKQSGSSLMLAAAEWVPLMVDALAGDVQEQCRILPVDGLDRCEELEQDVVRCSPGHPAYVIYTSGSTGVPKGAIVEHRGMLNHLYAKIRDLGLTEADTVAETASQCFDISVWQFLAALLVGGRVDICRDEIALDPPQLLREIQSAKITILETVPSLLRAMLEEIALRTSTCPDLSSLRWLIPTGEALPPELCRQWLSYYPEIPMLNAYGPTECSDDVTHYPIFQPPAVEVIHMPIGRPVANMQLHVLDGHLQPLPVGVAGELYVGGDGVGRGYLKDPVRTAEAFVPDPFSSRPGARMYKTGDLARYRPEGNIEFLGRVDYQVKVRGYRIELGEIETVLRQHPAVREAIVADRADPAGGRWLVAYVVSQSGYAIRSDELRRFLEQKLPDYMVPSALVALDAMPLTRTGKVDRKALPEPPSLRPELQVTFVEPQTGLEQTIAGIWLQVLGVEKVGIHDNFFDLGGNSLLILRVNSQLNQILSQAVPLVELFQHPTISALADLLRQEQAKPPVLDRVYNRAETHRESMRRQRQLRKNIERKQI